MSATPIPEAERDFYRLFGANVRRARELGGLSQRAVARMLRIEQPRVSSWETGRLRMNSDQLSRFVQVLCVSVSYLFEGTEDAAGAARLARGSRLTQHIP